MKKRIKIVAFLIVVGLIAWFVIISPIVNFHRNEKIMEQAARRYFEINSSRLPTGDRIRTVFLKELYHEKFLEKDIYVPFRKKTCSLNNSWVKVRKVNGEYEYYTYLECDYLKSSIDAKGPVITLNGKENVTISLDSEYKDEGVKSVVDNVDGKLDISEVSVRGEVDTTKTGTYDITYTAFDKLSNKTVVTRHVSVVQKIYDTVKKRLGDDNNYTGIVSDNYVRLSNMLFQIYGVDSNKNVILVSIGDIANVNYSKLDKWLDYFYNHLNEKTKKMIVPSKYCNMSVDDANVNSVLECNSYTKNKKIYIPSAVDVNKSIVDGGDSFMKPDTMSWVSTARDDKTAYVTRYVFFYDAFGKNFLAYDKDDNYGVRPMFTIKGNSLIVDGTGAFSDPFTFNDSKPVDKGTLLNNASTGEYITDGNVVWRVIEVMKDGTVKAITDSVIGKNSADVRCYQKSDEKSYTYNPNNKNSIAYCINNRINKYVDTTHLANHTIEVPVYKNKIIYGEEISTKKYSVTLSAPNMFEMFSAATDDFSGSYWCLNTSQQDGVAAAITEIGVPDNQEIAPYTSLSSRLVAFFKKDVVVVGGTGVDGNPYKIK